MAEFLPRAELYTEVLSGSAVVQDNIHKLYVSVIRFWERAIKFYKRRRLWNFIRLWSDFDVEFSALQAEIRYYGEKVEKAASDEHISRAQASRLEQSKINQGQCKRCDGGHSRLTTFP